MKEKTDRSNIPMKPTEKLNPEEERLIETFDELRKGQLEFLDQAGKRIIELSTGLLGLLFAVVAFGDDFPPPYLAGNPTAQWEAVSVLALLVIALLAGVITVQPKRYKFPRADLGRMRQELETILTFKSRWMKVATWAFFLGTGVLALLIGTLILS
jgi:hypothetical protein